LALSTARGEGIIKSRGGGFKMRPGVWQENFLRNAALTSSVYSLSIAGLHTLRIWMVGPGMVLDAIAGDDDNARQASYLYPPETRPVQK